jgi:homoserine kinase
MSAAAKSSAAANSIAPLRLRLPATSANLGPGFDAAALAMSLHLEVEAKMANKFSIHASGRNADLTGALENNLVLDTYRDVLVRNGCDVTPLAIIMRNEIPLGMGCGSSAAGILAGVAMAAHFGALGWDREQILDEACRIEGHPDNVAACWLGGMTLSAMVDGRCVAATIPIPYQWMLMLAMPNSPLSTKKARALLPDMYTRADAVFNVQRMALLTAAFAQERGELLTVAMQDKIHQPYRAAVCPLLKAVLPMAGSSGVLGAALSGAGPSALLIVERNISQGELAAAVQDAVLEVGAGDDVESLFCEAENRPALMI